MINCYDIFVASLGLFSSCGKCIMKGEQVYFRKNNNIVSGLYLTSVIDQTSTSVLPVVWS